MRRSSMRMLAGSAGAVAIGAMWTFVGLAKIADVVSPTIDPNESSRWIDQFPPAAVLSASAAECVTGACLLFGRYKVGFAGGLILLAAFSFVMVIVPVGDQPCGCAGSFGGRFGLDAGDPLLRNMAWSAVHVFVACLTLDIHQPLHARDEV